MEAFFCAHPRSVGETYCQHMGEAVQVGGTLIAAGLAALVHGVFPGWFTTTASDCARRVVASVDARAAKGA
jgi:hypothetical protein